jgi:hypothetical protein
MSTNEPCDGKKKDKLLKIEHTSKEDIQVTLTKAGSTAITTPSALELASHVPLIHFAATNVPCGNETTCEQVNYMTGIKIKFYLCRTIDTVVVTRIIILCANTSVWRNRRPPSVLYDTDAPIFKFDCDVQVTLKIMRIIAKRNQLHIHDRLCPISAL